jgi:hypothetical protein
MRAVFVVVRHVLREDLLEVTTTEDEEPVETLSAGRAYESLGDRVRTRRSNGRLDDPNALSAEHLVEAGGELRVSVPDEELDCSGTLGDDDAQVAGLLSDPLPYWAGGNA